MPFFCLLAKPPADKFRAVEPSFIRASIDARPIDCPESSAGMMAENETANHDRYRPCHYANRVANFFSTQETVRKWHRTR